MAKRMTVATRSKPSLTCSADELQAKMKTFNNHVDQVADLIAEMDSVASDDPDLKAHSTKMTQLSVESEHHIGGFKEMHKRYLAILG